MIRYLQPRVQFPRKSFSRRKLVGVMDEDGRKNNELETKQEENQNHEQETQSDEYLSPMHSLATSVKNIKSAFLAQTRDHAEEFIALIKLGLVIVFYVSGTFYFTMGPEKWTIIQSIYFLTCSYSTVGYGDVTPTQIQSRGVAIFFVFYGLVVVLPIFMGTAQYIMNWQVRQLNNMMQTFAHDVNPVHVKMLYSIILILIPMLLGCVYFGLQEARNGPWNIMDPIWFTVQTVTTIGYGDLSFDNVTTGRTFLILFIPFSVVTVGAALANMSEVMEDMKALRRERELLNRFDIDMIKALDTNGDGIDRQEYILGMLQALGQVDPDKVELYSRQFDEYDVDGSGTLDQDDLDLIGQQLKEEATHGNAAFRKSMTLASVPRSRAASPKSNASDNDQVQPVSDDQVPENFSAVELNVISGDHTSTSLSSADGNNYVDSV